MFEDELLQLFKRCAICGEDVLEKDLVQAHIVEMSPCNGVSGFVYIFHR